MYGEVTSKFPGSRTITSVGKHHECTIPILNTTYTVLRTIISLLVTDTLKLVKIITFLVC
jgi:hypothetical protein